MENIVNDYHTASIVPIYKRRDPAYPSSYRPIALISHMRKVIDCAISLIVQKTYTIHYSQLWFRAGTGVEIGILRHIVQWPTNPCTAILALKSAYELVQKGKLPALCERKLPEQIAVMFGTATLTTTLYTKDLKTCQKGRSAEEWQKPPR